MIRLAPSAGLSPLERFALEVLVDQARLLQSLEPTPSVVTVRIATEDGSASTLRDLAARGWGFQVVDGEVLIPRVLLAEVGSTVSARAEQLTDDADRFQRVPTRVNAMYASGSPREPLVSRCAEALRAAVVNAAGRRPLAFLQPWPDGRRWAAALSHDLDVVDWWGAFTALRIAELARKSEWRQVARIVGAVPGGLTANPVVAAARRLLATERDAGVRSTWFVLCGEPGLASARRGDLTYRPGGRRTRGLLSAITSGGHEIGLHGSFATMLSSRVFTEQRTQLESIAGASIRGARQHYLRMRPGDTQRAMKEAGFSYDATFGFPDCSGFRLGVADVVPWWDAAHGAVADFDVVPLVWMDRTLSKYQGIEDPRRWVEDALELASVCADVEGLWVGLWHPNLAAALGYPGAEEAFSELVARLVAMQPHIAPLGELVAWRRDRRSVRAATLDARGRPVRAGTPADGSAAMLEDAEGRAVRWSDD